jgi:hypothetical protein
MLLFVSQDHKKMVIHKPQNGVSGVTGLMDCQSENNQTTYNLEFIIRSNKEAKNGNISLG